MPTRAGRVFVRQYDVDVYNDVGRVGGRRNPSDDAAIAMSCDSMQPTVTKSAKDRAEQFKRDSHRVVYALERRLRNDLRQTDDFRRIHPMPQSGQNVPDDLDAKLVVLSVDHICTKESGRAAEIARAILDSRGNAPDLYRNTLVFPAADKTRPQDLEEAARKCLTCETILAKPLAIL